MKKLGAFLAGVGLLASATFAADSNTATSVNAVGFFNVTLPAYGQFIVVGSPFDATGNDTNVQRTLNDVFGGNCGLRKSTSRSQVDRVYVWDVSSQKYLILGQKTNDLFAPVATATTWNQPTNIVIPRGYAMFVQSWSAATTDSVITLAGQVPSAVSNSLPILGDPGSSPFQMLVNPYPLDTTLDSLINSNNGAYASSSRSQCDRVYVWDKVSQKYGILGLKAPSNRWFYCSTATLWSSNIPPVSVGIGEGFWYIGKTNFTWSSGKTYVWP